MGTFYFGNGPSLYRTVPGKFAEVFAGGPLAGHVDGAPTDARFGGIVALVIDPDGNIYVADADRTIRKVTPTGLVSTIAGLAGTPAEVVDGAGSAARFYWPADLAFDGEGNLLVADVVAVRRVTPDGQVTTISDTTGMLFLGMTKIACDGFSVFVRNDDFTIRRIESSGKLSVWLGAEDESGNQDGSRLSARLISPDGGIAFDRGRQLGMLDGNVTLRIVTFGDEQVQTRAGAAASNAWRDGVGGDARLDFPRALRAMRPRTSS